MTKAAATTPAPPTTTSVPTITTRKQKASAALQHVLTVVLEKDQTDDAEYFNWITGNKIKSMHELLAIKPDRMEVTKYDNDGNMELPTMGMLGNVEILQAFAQFFTANNQKVIGNDDWLAVSADEYNLFKTTDYNTYNPIPPNPSSKATGSPAKTVDPIADFKKGIKRDASQFAKLKDDSQWDNWNRDIITTARAQNVEDVLDSKFRATTNADKELFKEHQKFMYDVFSKSCLTDKTKSIVRKHFQTYDAQKVYSELEAHFTKSTKAQHSSSSLLTYLTSASIADGKWTGTTQGFILNWQNKLRLYNELKPITEKLSEVLQLTLIKNAVKGLQTFQTVQENEDNSFTRTGINLDYEQYSQLLLSAAENYDIQISPKKGQKSSTRGIYSTSITEDHGTDEELDIDSTIDMIQANFSRTSSMPKTRWDGLPPEVKKIWDTMDDDSKAIILGNIDPKTKLPIAKTSDNRRPPNRPANRDTRTRSTNQHDIIQAFLTNVQQDTIHEDEDNTETIEVDAERLEQFTQALLAFNASQTTSEKSKASSPADIRSVLSQPSKKTAFKKVTPTNTQVEVNEVVFNGSTYRLVKD
jgi:hypothetical protein